MNNVMMKYEIGQIHGAIQKKNQAKDARKTQKTMKLQAQLRTTISEDLTIKLQSPPFKF